MSSRTEGLEVLALPLDHEDCRWHTTPGATVRDYLIELLAQFWAGEADPKYGMVGGSDWQHDLYVPLRNAGLIPAWEDGWGVGRRTDGTARPEDQQHADALIAAAIRALPYSGRHQ